ncbi:MAG: hypothetical protein ISS77_08375 [Phycisphaerae bacterium]|nr:hypothetical protein [Phycisphaerae bacterium]
MSDIRCGFAGKSVFCAALLAVLASFSLVLVGGCSEMALWGDALEFARPEGAPDYNDTYDWYEKVGVRQSSSGDVLMLAYVPDYELLSKSKNVIAVSGEKKIKGYKGWFKMAGFDEDDMLVRRKYLFVEDERPKVLFIDPWQAAAFDCEVVISNEVLDKPYADNYSRQLAILKYVLEKFREDFRSVQQDNKQLGNLAMMVNQTLGNSVVHVEESPALVDKIFSESGVVLAHPNMDIFKIRVILEDDVAAVRFKCGSSAKRLKKDEL